MRAVFADTFYWVATVLPDDPWFPVVADVSAKLNDAHFVTTDEVLTEFLAHLSSWGPHYRRAAVELVRTVLGDEDVTVILADGSVAEFLIHEEADCEQPVQLRSDLGQETSIFRCQEKSHGPNHSETE